MLDTLKAESSEREEMQRATDLLIERGQQLSPQEVRELLATEGIGEPVIGQVVSRMHAVLKKVKSGATFSWDA
jgi:hypothetical protein